MSPTLPAAARCTAATGKGRPLPGPRLADGAELLGRYQGSGCVEARYLIRRPDGRVVEISPLLQLVAATLDDGRPMAEIAADVSRTLGRTVSAANVEYLAEHKLRPLGVLAGDHHPPARPAAADPLLGLSLRLGVIPPRVVRVAATLLKPLFAPVVVLAVLAGLVVLDVWLVQTGRVGGVIPELVSTPALLVVVVALTLVAGAFHELGHATASRYGGAEPGVIGAGIYLMWPVFYNDLNDSYRLSRGGRLRADLGGVYFNAVFIVLLFGAYGTTGAEPLLAAIVVQHLVVLQQFLPFVRLDGYYIVSDLAGVPDLFGHIRPVLSGLAPGRPRASTVAALRPGARVAVTAWVVLTVPLLGGLLVLFVIGLPGLVAAVAAAVTLQLAALEVAVAAGDGFGAVLSGLQLVFLAVPVVGLGIPLLRALHRLRRRSRHRRRRRPLAVRGRIPQPAPQVVEGGTRAGDDVLDRLDGVMASMGFGPGRVGDVPSVVPPECSAADCDQGAHRAVAGV